MSSFVSMTVLVQTGTRSTLVLVLVMVKGTISVTHSKVGSGGGVMTQGVCLQVWQASAVLPVSETVNTMAASQFGRTLMMIYLQAVLSSIHWGSRFENARAGQGR